MSMTDDIRTAVAAMINASGQAITYVPADSGVSSFTCMRGPAGDGEMQHKVNRNLVGDQRVITVLHEDLAANDWPIPRIAREKSPSGSVYASGDQIIDEDLSGNAETWTVVHKTRSEGGYWELVIERNLRIVA